MARRFPFLVVAALLLPAAGLLAQGTSAVAIGYAWLDVGGSENAFNSQFNLGDGVFLESLHLDMARWVKGTERFEMTADGWGAEPYRSAGLRLDAGNWSVRLGYRRGESFFALPDWDAGVQRERWAVSRLTGSVEYDGWSAVRLQLLAREVRRSGWEQYPFYGLGIPYAASVDLDERIQELGVAFETKTLPVKLYLEQDWARVTRTNRAAPGNNGGAAGVSDPDELVALETPGDQDGDVPTTIVGAVYRGERLELVGRGLYRTESLDVNADSLEDYAIGAGGLRYVDQLSGSANRDQTVGDLLLGFVITKGLTARLRGSYQDTSADGRLLGERAVSLYGPGGSFELGEPVDDATAIDRTDTAVGAELQWQRGALTLTAEWTDASREVAWRLGEDGSPYEATRDLQGWGLTAALAFGRTASFEVGWRDRQFETFVFRTDPEAVERAFGQLRLRLAERWELSAYGSRERADNEVAGADLDRSLDSYGASATWTGDDGGFVAFAVDWLDLAGEIGTLFWAPGPTTGLSRYSSELLTASLRAGLRLGQHLRLQAGGTSIDDGGDSLPFASWSGDLRLEYADGPLGLDYALFGQWWSYDQDEHEVQDYDVGRYGVSLGWRF